MGNTQVTPIRPAIPPLINLAGKLVKMATTEEEPKKKKKMKHDKSIDVNKTDMLLFVFAPPPTLPDLLVSHLCEALAGQSVSLFVS